MIIEGNKFEFVDTMENPITVADSWVKPKNKLGGGNGEAKLYFGSKDKMELFFGGHGFIVYCFIVKRDLLAYMNAIREEYFHPSQNYRGKEEMRSLWHERMAKINALPDIITFQVKEQTQIGGVRGYVNSTDEIYQLIREISLPLVTYISAMHLTYNGHPLYYWKLFADFQEIEKRKAFIENYGISADREEEEEEEDHWVVREEPIRPIPVRYVREGQDDYRKKLLAECPFCPITMINEESLLIASHIKPWAVSNTTERIDPNNGFILSPLYDKLFDRGYITFSYDKRVSISNWLSRQVKERIGIKENQFFQFLPINTEREKYLEYHRESVFKG